MGRKLTRQGEHLQFHPSKTVGRKDVSIRGREIDNTEDELIKWLLAWVLG